MRSAVLIVTITACVQPMPPSTSSAEQAINGYCTTSVGKIQCSPDYATYGDFCPQACMDYNGQSGYCPEYTQGELNNCANPTLCHSAWGIAHCTDTCYPATFHFCILGEQP